MMTLYMVRDKEGNVIYESYFERKNVDISELA